MKKRAGDKRERQIASDPSDIDGYLGPWGKYVDEETVSKPPEEDQAYLKEVSCFLMLRPLGTKMSRSYNG